MGFALKMEKALEGKAGEEGADNLTEGRADCVGVLDA